MMMSRRFLLFLSLIASILISPAASAHGWYLVDSELVPSPLEANTQPVRFSNSLDFDNDGIVEKVILENEQVIVQSGEDLRWESPKAWQVHQFQIADLNHDGMAEIILLVWRPFKPWPVDAWLPKGGRIDAFHNKAGMSCHIILIGWNGNSFRERWAGSALAEPVKVFAVADLAGNGKQFLITLESRYDDPPSTPAQKLKVWEWNGFGFTVVSQVSGAFNQLAIARENSGRLLIIAP